MEAPLQFYDQQIILGTVLAGTSVTHVRRKIGKGFSKNNRWLMVLL